MKRLNFALGRKGNQTLLSLLLGVLLLSSCNDVDNAAKEVLAFDPAYLATQSNTTTLSWDDLLPVGEEAELSRQQREFYADLNSKLSGLRQQTLADAARQGGYDQIEEGSSLDYMPQLGTFNVVAELDEERVRIPGFIVPLQSDGIEKYTEFLLVPYFGACIHLPPPPPNQVVYVTSAVPVNIERLAEAFFVEGRLTTRRQDTEFGNSAYSLELDTIMFYDE